MNATHMNDAIVSNVPTARRHFLAQCGVGVGWMALAAHLQREVVAASPSNHAAANPLRPRQPHHQPTAKSIIFLCMAGGPSQLETFSHKPELAKLHDKAPPPSILEGRRFAFLKGNEKLLGPLRPFSQYGQSGAWVSDLLPHLQKQVDDMCIINSMQTDVFNHGPAKTFLNCGSSLMGRPSMGAWLTYGLGSEADDLPGFVVMLSGPRGPRNGAQLWSSGFLPTTYQGVAFRNSGSPVLNLETPPGIDPQQQAEFFSTVSQLNTLRQEAVGDPEISTRIAAYETAYRMQISAPELIDLSRESQATLDAYGATPSEPSFANNCLLARRLVEKGVRFVQLYHTNWDHHGGAENINTDLPLRCQQIDQPVAALLNDLKERGLLQDTIVVWGGEFGRTPLGEIRADTVGRDHHIDGYTMWLAGGGFRPGTVWGRTDELGMGVVENPVHVHDLHATLLHCMGIEHTQLTYRFQGRDFRLTDVHGRVVREILA
ncbi:MAG: DUF1501 domain-containing protein [Planctomycetota bacterium]|nr:DUF1501 domain-containing protein [Planctomycetota bacterium]